MQINLHRDVSPERFFEEMQAKRKDFEEILPKKQAVISKKGAKNIKKTLK
jgi:hypothetical protein